MMISQINGSVVRNAYASSIGENKETSQKQGMSVSKQGDMSRVDQIKEALASGEYKINLEALSKKIAEELI